MTFWAPVFVLNVIFKLFGLSAMIELWFQVEEVVERTSVVVCLLLTFNCELNGGLKYLTKGN
jgi:hypothetical protein